MIQWQPRVLGYIRAYHVLQDLQHGLALEEMMISKPVTKSCYINIAQFIYKVRLIDVLDRRGQR